MVLSATLIHGCQTFVENTGDVGLYEVFPYGNGDFRLNGRHLGQLMECKFADVMFTPLHNLGGWVRCCGRLRYNLDLSSSIDLYPPQDCWDVDEHIVHFGKIPRIAILSSDDNRIIEKARRNEEVEIEGRVVFSEHEFHPFFDATLGSVALADCRLVEKSIGHGVTAMQCRWEYHSPCREFKLRLRNQSGYDYLLHCYSGTVWAARAKGWNASELLPPCSLYYAGMRIDQLRNLWQMLERIDVILFGEYSGSRPIFCRAKACSEIEEISHTVIESPELLNCVEEVMKEMRNLHKCR